MLFSLQADIETLRDELEFKNHKIDEYENMLQAERHRVKDLGQELQVLNPYQYYYYYYYYCLVTIFSYYMALLRLQNRNISAGKQCSRQVTSLINNDNSRYHRHHHHYCNGDNNNNYYNDHDHGDDDDDGDDV